MSRSRTLFVATLAVVVLAGTIGSVANAQQVYTPKPAPWLDTLVRLSDSVSLYSEAPIWVDTAEQYDTENAGKYSMDSTKALLKGFKLTRAQLTALDKGEALYMDAIVVLINRANSGHRPGNSARRYNKIMELLQHRQITMTRPLLTPEQRTIYDERVKALLESEK